MKYNKQTNPLSSINRNVATHTQSLPTTMPKLNVFKAEGSNRIMRQSVAADMARDISIKQER